MGIESTDHVVKLKDGRDLAVTIYTYPIARADQMKLIALLQTEWDRSDLDWLPSMRGAYAQTLRSQVALGSIDGQPVGTTMVGYAVQDPEVCLIENVITHPDWRGRGIAAGLTDLVVDLGFAAGCRVAFLGNAPNPHSVYLRCEFVRLSGAMMRRPSPGAEDCEADFYRKGQRTSIRQTTWGDMPAVACLMAQPMDCIVADYPRGLASIEQVPPVRCASNFTTMWYEVAARQGTMLTLGGEKPHRALGVGTLTPGPPPIRNHVAAIDLILHDNYADQAAVLLDRLIDEARHRKLDTVEAHVARDDARKTEWFTSAGLIEVATLSRRLRLNGRLLDVVVLQADLAD